MWEVSFIYWGKTLLIYPLCSQTIGGFGGPALFIPNRKAGFSVFIGSCMKCNSLDTISCFLFKEQQNTKCNEQIDECAVYSRLFKNYDVLFGNTWHLNEFCVLTSGSDHIFQNQILSACAGPFSRSSLTREVMISANQLVLNIQGKLCAADLVFLRNVI